MLANSRGGTRCEEHCSSSGGRAQSFTRRSCRAMGYVWRTSSAVFARASHAVEECLMRVESVLVHLPHRQQLPEPTTSYPQSWTRGVQGAIANCTKSLFSIPLPSDDSSPMIEGIAMEALVAQVYYVWAFVHSYKHLGGKEEVDRLGEAIAALKRAGRDGLFVS